MKSFALCIFLTLSVSAWAAPSQVAQQQQKPMVQFEDLINAAAAASTQIEVALREAVQNLEAAVGGTETEAGQKIKEILVQAETEATRIVHAAIEKLQTGVTLEEAARVCDDAIAELLQVGANAAAEIQKVADDLPDDVQAKVDEILRKLAVEIATALEPLVKLVEEALGEGSKLYISSVRNVTQEQIVAAAITAFIEIDRSLQRAVASIEQVLATEEPSIGAAVQEILADAKKKVEVTTQTALADVEQAQTEQEIFEIAQQFVTDLEKLGYDTKAAIEEAVKEASAEAIAQVQTVLDNLVIEIRVAITPLQDLLNEAIGEGR